METQTVSLLHALKETKASLDSLSVDFKEALSRPTGHHQAGFLAQSKVSSNTCDKENSDQGVDTKAGPPSGPGSAKKRHFRLRQMYKELKHLR